MTTSTTTKTTSDPSATTRLDDVAGTVRSVAGEVATRIPDAATATREALTEADRQMRAGSDDSLAIGATLSFGLALGLLIGGANRVLVAVALAPAAAMAFTLLGRAGGAMRSRPTAR